ncbi:hypothetical protein OG885_42100 [Streptomyces sp. NBC_00028]|uniref:hypothetical protein n=1 Tax=Streptomyces sp. NBC_00028 TaxID=2975624 RepID=UPI003250A623
MHGPGTDLTLRLPEVLQLSSRTRTELLPDEHSTGHLDPARVDGSLNCLLNEGAAGVHLGVGNGLDGVHFDFISTEARLVTR